ncbi:MAG: ribonuclease E/G [Rhodospirillaceae bacterium]
MSTKRMLIDSSHPEETRVVIADGNRLEELDFESEQRRQLKGNIYLAKVTRVEPSLQACFVDYGGNRHGFLAFSEIHPDYYQIPVADREKLVAEQQALEAKHDDDHEEDGGEEKGVEVVGGDEDEEIPVRRPDNVRRQYKIQEVIKRRQILLIQVVKEERGNKGAALTTYLSLAGRYCVLMPNTARGGGISRKIANSADRKKLKEILADLDIPKGMAVIVRTAGSKRTKAEIRRDYDYLFRVWSEVRGKTLKSIAPCLVHAEGDVVKRAIRDLYTKDIDEIIVEGVEAYRSAKDFMKLLIPSHAKKVQPQKEGSIPLFQQFRIEDQLNAMHEPEVQLKSGGYIVINPTEALVSIDVNSGRATKERNIEETALKTNVEAAEEIARQLRLRDLAGLIVIDFIDMEVSRNQAKVERALKDSMRSDRARIQIGRISPFGLLEMSRQRLRPSLHESSFEQCPHCAGTGVRRATESTALQMLRVLGEESQKGQGKDLILHTPTAVALYLFNNKRHAIAELEKRYNIDIRIENDDALIPPDFRLERINAEGSVETAVEAQGLRDDDHEEESGKRRRRRSRRRRRGRDGEAGDHLHAADEHHEPDYDHGYDRGHEDDDDHAEEHHADARPGDEEGEERKHRKRRRGRRGGRRRRRAEAGHERGDGHAEDYGDGHGDGNGDAADDADAAIDAADADDQADGDGPDAAAAVAGDGPKKSRTRRGRRKKAVSSDADAALDDADGDDAGADANAADGGDDAEAKKPRRSRARKAAKKDAAPKDASKDAATVPEKADARPEPAAKAEAPETKPGNGSADGSDATAEKPVQKAPSNSAESAKTLVIEVGKEPAADSNARKGWWRRPAE